MNVKECVANRPLIPLGILYGLSVLLIVTSWLQITAETTEVRMIQAIAGISCMALVVCPLLGELTRERPRRWPMLRFFIIIGVSGMLLTTSHAETMVAYWVQGVTGIVCVSYTHLTLPTICSV